MLKRVLALTLAVAAAATAQTPARRATNLDMILAYPAYFHQRPVLLVGNVTTNDRGELTVSNDSLSLRVVYKGTVTDGLDEVRGEFIDLGRMKPDDPRLASLDLRGTFHVDPDGPWPKTGEVTAVLASSITPTSPPPAPSIRAIVLNPTRYLDQTVSIVGQYQGRNLAADLPDAPARSRYDFVLRSADAAIWVSNIRPKTKDFDLGLDARIDTGRWLRVTGVVQQGRGLQWIEAKAGTLEAAKAPTDTAEPEPEPTIRVPAAPPPEVVFSAPTEDETDVAVTTNVRIQFSRDLDASTLKGHVRVHYLDAQTVERGEPTTPKAEFSTEYRPGNRELVITFAKPLERFRTIKIDLGSEILGTDGQALKPWTLTFALGGS